MILEFISNNSASSINLHQILSCASQKHLIINAAAQTLPDYITNKALSLFLFTAAEVSHLTVYLMRAELNHVNLSSQSDAMTHLRFILNNLS